MKQLPHYWTYRGNLPEPPALPLKDRPAYLIMLFEEAYNQGYEQAQADIREALGVLNPPEINA